MSRRVALIVATLLSFSIACHRGPDPTPTATKALQDAHLAAVKVEWDSDAHVAHLTGTVNTPTDRQRAQDVAAAAVGTSGKVLNEVTIKGVNDRTAGDLDRDIKRAVKQAIDGDPVLRERDIDLDVNNGAVLVKGEVQSAAEKSRVTELVRNAPGVRDMANALEIKPEKKR
jgi:hyperosmotically inducible periplasmic protein